VTCGLLVTAIGQLGVNEHRIELGRALVVRGEDDDLSRAHDLFVTSGAPTDRSKIPQRDS
jgi:hypothetical protein